MKFGVVLVLFFISVSIYYASKLFEDQNIGLESKVDSLEKVLKRRDDIKKDAQKNIYKLLNDKLAAIDQSDSQKKLKKEDEVIGEMLLLLLQQIGIRLTAKQKQIIGRDGLLRVNKNISMKKDNPKYRFISDPYRNSLCPECPQCIEEQKKVIKKPLNKNAMSRWLDFRDLIPFKRRVRDLVDRDIFNNLWKNENFKGELRALNSSLIRGYTGVWEGQFRNANGDHFPVRMHLYEESKTSSKDFLLTMGLLSLNDKNILYLKDILKGFHPRTHAQGKGHCRGVVLDSNGLRITLMGLKFVSPKTLIGKVYRKSGGSKLLNKSKVTKLLGYLFLKEKGGKKDTLFFQNGHF